MVQVQVVELEGSRHEVMNDAIMCMCYRWTICLYMIGGAIFGMDDNEKEEWTLIYI